uniref:Uncharacterized protein n=1 Tax=Oryza punctata TaxID=4537 RepID=A0A0E0M4Z2_ORYPU
MDSPSLTQQQQNIYNDTEEEWCSPEELKRFYESVTMLEYEYNLRSGKFISNRQKDNLIDTQQCSEPTKLYDQPKSTLLEKEVFEDIINRMPYSGKSCDSGVYIMKLFQSFDGNTNLFFRPEDAKTLREKLTYYLVANDHNEKHNPEIRAIEKKHGVTL